MDESAYSLLSRRSPSLGDDLNGVVWPGLAPELFEGAARSADGFLEVGTLIGRSFPEVRRTHVFSSGVGYDPIAGFHPSSLYWCVQDRFLLAFFICQVTARSLTAASLLRSDWASAACHRQTNRSWCLIGSRCGRRLGNGVRPRGVLVD